MYLSGVHLIHYLNSGYEIYIGWRHLSENTSEPLSFSFRCPVQYLWQNTFFLCVIFIKANPQLNASYLIKDTYIMRKKSRTRTCSEKRKFWHYRPQWSEKIWWSHNWTRERWPILLQGNNIRPERSRPHHKELCKTHGSKSQQCHKE